MYFFGQCSVQLAIPGTRFLLYCAGVWCVCACVWWVCSCLCECVFLLFALTQKCIYLGNARYSWLSRERGFCCTARVSGVCVRVCGGCARVCVSACFCFLRSPRNVFIWAMLGTAGYPGNAVFVVLRGCACVCVCVCSCLCECVFLLFALTQKCIFLGNARYSWLSRERGFCCTARVCGVCACVCVRVFVCLRACILCVPLFFAISGETHSVT